MARGGCGVAMQIQVDKFLALTAMLAGFVPGESTAQGPASAAEADGRARGEHGEHGQQQGHASGQAERRA